MTAGSARWSPEPRELDDFECLALGAFGPGRGFVGPGEAGPTLRVPPDIAVAAVQAGVLELLDEEGALAGSVRVRAVVDPPAPGGSPYVLGDVMAGGGGERGGAAHL
ncbi:MAG: hypothetical protein M3P48_00985, partial [Actinomycetota bacterium]|nr:hypothetical protein [Actinomycetota bacterium]